MLGVKSRLPTADNLILAFAHDQKTMLRTRDEQFAFRMVTNVFSKIKKY